MSSAETRLQGADEAAGPKARSDTGAASPKIAARSIQFGCHQGAYLMINRHSAQHYSWKEVCDGWHLVASDTLSVIQERMPPHTREDMHRHQRAFQFFFMLSGQGVMRLDSGPVALSPMDGIEIKPGLWHQMCNDSDADVEFLVVSAPKAHGDKEIME